MRVRWDLYEESTIAETGNSCQGGTLNTMKRIFTKPVYRAACVLAAIVFLAPTAGADGIGSIGKLFGKIDSSIRDQVKKEPAQALVTPLGNSHLATGQRDAGTVEPLSENNSEVVEPQVNTNPSPPVSVTRRSSTLDNLMGSDQPKRTNASSAMTKMSFLAEFESDYLEKSDDAGRLPGMKQSHDKVANALAITLPAEFGVSAACVQQRRRDGRVTGSPQAMTIAAVMYDVIDQLAPSTNKGGMLHDRVKSLSQPGIGCPNDFPAIKQFLSEYSDFAKSMVDHKLALVTNRKAKAQEQVRQDKMAADHQASEKASKERQVQEREAEMRRQKRESDDKRKIALRSGAEKPASFRDYMLMHDYGAGDQFYGSPLLKPDNKVYLFGTGGLDREDGEGLIVRNSGGDYIHVITNRSTPIYGELRIKMAIVVIGRYVGNTQYTTVMGAVRTAPMIEAIAVSKAPVYY